MQAGHYHFLHLGLQGDHAHLCRVELPIRHKLGPARAESCDQDSKTLASSRSLPILVCTAAHAQHVVLLQTLGTGALRAWGVSACPQMLAQCRGWESPPLPIILRPQVPIGGPQASVEAVTPESALCEGRSQFLDPPGEDSCRDLIRA